MLRFYLGKAASDAFENMVIAPLTESSVKADAKLVGYLEGTKEEAKQYDYWTLTPNKTLLKKLAGLFEKVGKDEDVSGASIRRPFNRVADEIRVFVANSGEFDADDIIVRGRSEGKVRGNDKS